MRMPINEHPPDGAVLPLVTICLVGLLGFVALAIDVGMMAVARTQAQSAADIASLAGARTLNGQTGNNKTNAEAEAKRGGQANYILGTQITDAQVVTVQDRRVPVRHGAHAFRGRLRQRLRAAPRPTAPCGSDDHDDQDTYFGTVLGVNSMAVSAEATAVHRPRDIAISLDFSGSMRFSSEFNYPPISRQHAGRPAA